MLDAEVYVTYEGFTLDAHLRCGEDELVAVVGPNGAGKTTLLRAIAGLEGRSPIDDRIGFVPQENFLFPHMDVVGNVAFGSDRATAAHYVDLVGMTAYARRKPHELSGGQCKRVAIARALAREPRVLLMDEPFDGLDAATRRDIRRFVAAWSGARIVVSHHPLDALALADRVVVLEAGRIVQDAAPAELNARPRSRYVADLVGTNLYRGVFEGGVLHTGTGADIVTSASVEGTGLATIHPRAVSLFVQRPHGSPRNVWAGTIVAIEPSGDALRVQIEGEIAVVAELTRDAANEMRLARGMPVFASVKATEVVVDAG
jgi:molybdate transport system ATP-binding protein